jgi:NAD(P)-dependent dehydrogenase (short-subunit alcohol dehydrogenase family)
MLELDLSGKVAIVTGAGSGMGAVIATQMASSGAAVAIVGRNPDRLQDTHDRIAAAGGRCQQIVADLDQDAQVRAIAPSVTQRFGTITTLVHCAGVFEPAPMDGDIAVLDRSFATNVRASFLLTAACLPHLRASPGASIVFLSSTAAHIGFPGVPAYTATKGALDALVRSLAVEEARHDVRAVSVVPGTVRTPMNAEYLSDPVNERGEIEAVPLERLGSVDDVAACVVFLASDLASYITGVSLPVDGGLMAGRSVRAH